MPKTVVLWQDDFPFYDTLPLSEAMLDAAFPGAAHVPADALAEALAQPDVSLLVLPYGSAFPFQAWEAIVRHLASGHHLLTIGGAPFSVPIHAQRIGFSPGRPTVAFQRVLGINDFTAISTLDLDLTPAHSSFSNIGGGWRARRSWALQVRLADESHYDRLGGMGLPHARIEALLRARTAGGRVLATPGILLDHFYGRFAGSRWVMLNFEAEDGFNGSEEAVRLYSAAQRVALRGPLRLDVRPDPAVVAQGERPSLLLHAQAWQEYPNAVARVVVSGPDNATLQESQQPLSLGLAPQYAAIALPPTDAPGLYRVQVRLRSGSQSLGQYTTGYYCRDVAAPWTGPGLNAGPAFLERDGRPFPIAGTTYMSRDAHRQFLTRPNPAHWEEDFAAMAKAGISFVRTGIWSGHDQVMREPGIIREEVLRAFEAYLLAAGSHDIAVQFCFFAFQPEAFGNGNPYLDPDAVARQRDFIAAFVRRFHDVPHLSWDLINEPSQFDPSHLFQQRPLYDRYEAAAWNAWLQRRYASYVDLLRAWNAAPDDIGPWGTVREPRTEELTFRQRWGDDKPLIAADWQRFSQETFASWAQGMVDLIRKCGSTQMVAVGQDEGAVDGRPSPFFHGGAIDHACVHTWWLNDALLWDQLCASVPGKPLLVQETGIMHYERLDQGTRRDEQNRAHLLERKLALAFGAGAGFVQWLWNTNTDMPEDNEVAIGALRADGSEKPEMDVIRRVAAWSRTLADHAGAWEPEPVLVVQSQSLLHSVQRDLAIRSTQAAVRTLAYRLASPCRVLGENCLEQAGAPRLIIAPYPRALSEPAWQALLTLVRRGATLALNGPLGDEHGHPTDRLTPYGLAASISPVTARHCLQETPDSAARLAFSGESLNRVDSWRFADGTASWWQTDLGAGRIVAVSYAPELNDDEEATADVYRALLSAVRSPVSPWLTVHACPDGTLVWPRRFPGATLFTILSESSTPGEVAFRDERSGAEVRIDLQPERAALLLLNADGAPVSACLHGRLEVAGRLWWTGDEAVVSWAEGGGTPMQLVGH